MGIQHNGVMIFRPRRAEPGENVRFTGVALDAEVRQRALRVVPSKMTRDEFLTWLHETVTHAGPEKYLDLVEMACVPEEVDAGEGRWWRESEEAEPLREWTDLAIIAVANGEEPGKPPKNWKALISDKFLDSN